MKIRDHQYFNAFIITFSTLVIVGFAFFVVFSRTLNTTKDLRLGDGVFKADFALDYKSRTKGLSGTEKLDSNKALIMVFPHESRWSIWMRGMKFPIDIIWLNSNKTVVYIEKDVSSNSFPASYRPIRSAKYVIELAAGTADRKAITIGTVASFQVDQKDVK